MNRIILTFIAGGIFGLGIAISGMANPAKVLNFFDIAGTFDPSLIFVMGGALITTAIGYRLVFASRPKPVFDTRFHLPANRAIDARLLAGAAAFGTGWGIAGFCPGGAIPAIGFGGVPVIVFVAALTAGIMAARTIDGMRLKPARTA